MDGAAALRVYRARRIITMEPGLPTADAVAVRDGMIVAAWSLRLEWEIGSISAGKRADFAVLDADPFAVEPDAIKDIGVVATMFEGTVFGV